MKKTHATTWRGDIRTIATLAMYFEKREPIKNAADVLRKSIEAMKILVLQKHPELRFESTTQAVDYLESKGFFDVGKIIRNKKSLLDELSLEDLKEDSIIPNDDLIQQAKDLLSKPQVSDVKPPEDVSEETKSILSRPPWATGGEKDANVQEGASEDKKED